MLNKPLVDVSPFVSQGVYEVLFIDRPQQRVRKAFIGLFQNPIQIRLGYVSVYRCVVVHGLELLIQAQSSVFILLPKFPSGKLGIIGIMTGGIDVVDVFLYVAEQLFAGKIFCASKHYQVDNHVVGKQEPADDIQRHGQSFVFGIAISAGGNQGKAMLSYWCSFARVKAF